MANKNVFKSNRSGRLKTPQADTINQAGGLAYDLDSRTALAQLVCSGTFNNTFYANAESQLDKLVELLNKNDPQFIAKCAVYARTEGFMKDMPAFLLAYLCSTDIDSFTLEATFNKVVNNVKMLRNFVQIMRSGQINGRKSLGSRPKRLVQNWLSERPDEILFRDSVGNDPSLVDVVKMVHPRPVNDKQNAFYNYLLNGTLPSTVKATKKLLPDNVIRFEALKAGGEIDSYEGIDHRKLTSLPLSTEDWTAIALEMGWQALRMNLQTLQRHGVFNNPDIVAYVANKLRDAKEIKKARVFPYQLLMAYKQSTGLPAEIQSALQDAMEFAVENVPELEGGVTILLDVSGSMSSPVTGTRQGATSAVRNMDVAALMAATLMRKNPNAVLIPYDDYPREVRINPRDSIMTLAQQLSINGGGTDTSVAMKEANIRQSRASTLVILSDNQSWMDDTLLGTTASMVQWELYRKRVPNAKLVCVNISPYTNSQVPDRKDILNVGGFSDNVFSVINQFVHCERKFGGWVEIIDQIKL